MQSSNKDIHSAIRSKIKAILLVINRMSSPYFLPVLVYSLLLILIYLISIALYHMP
ncbi:hypothetical protein FUAX_49260 (plasmid) [Fulvitalea axinellae]|uniref:Uncharacterized protein n=1 Tax=Fulvitalea axinellae TaxID=1182444 RepID=A0AAU9CK86_9BACT|nr:hypothetical protein FUAX_49260 [Fulvitalea axinellae]